MRILTRTQYDAIVDIVSGQKKIIAEKEAEIKRLKAQVERLAYLLEGCLRPKPAYRSDIDFPNSERKEDYESSNIFDL